MNQYQKVYMNQIHSSSLLGQLAQMWKSQMLCDALIRTGNVTTKAHRVVLVAACPMLQSMDNASVGSHLEVRLAADIKQEAVNSFLQYLYEGFMMLSEENCKDVEKVARLLQVDSVTKCCIDFYNCLQKKTGVPVYSNTQYKYSSADLLEFRHVRTTDLQKTLHERMMKRAAADSVRPTSPSGKRQRMQQQRPPSPNIDLAMFGQKADDTLSMAHSYMGNIGNQAAAEPWERVPRIGAIHSQRQSHPKPGVIEIVEDSLEILQTQPPDKDGNKSAPPIIQKSLAISVSSQVNSSTDVHVVNVNDSSSHPTAAGDGPIMSTGRDSITVSPLTVMPGTSSLSSSSTSSPLTKDPHKSAMDKDMSDKQPYAKKLQSSLDHQSSTPQRGLFPVSISPANMSPINQVKKSFAAGSASQAASMSQSHDSPAKRTPTSAVNEMERPPSSDSGKDLGTKSKVDDRSALNSTDMAPDLSIVKVEPTGEAGLDMYVDVPEESMIQAQQREQREHDDESDLELEEASGDWSRDEMSNEAAGGDQNNSWYIGQFKGSEVHVTETGSQRAIQIDDDDSDSSDSAQINWGVKLFRGWLVSVNLPVEFEIYTVSDLNDVLCQFYLEAKSKRGDPYQLCTLIDVKNALKRYLSGISQQWCDSWKDVRSFESSNRILDSIREAIKDSIPRNKAPSKLPMTQEDRNMFIKSGLLCTSNPLGLFRKVWFDLSLHLGCGGQAAMRSLTADMFVTEIDEQNRRYYRLNKCSNVESARSKMEMQYWDWEGRMYEIPGDPNCPVSAMDLYLSKRNPHKNAFFQRPKTHINDSTDIWYESQVGHGVLASIMSRMSEDAGLSRLYTNTSVRVTAAEVLEKNCMNVDAIMGINPKNKTAKSVQQAMARTHTSDELFFNSKTLHEILYGFS
ncbi:uncharacterized protein LOC127705183 isoform X4 [Mytilus californianus]|uniref:uncharacterized protein LOC127705183 isoform X4 n=1 Tax=Mytilus californianus TaxID=6549 RepID=UPI002247BDA9|nr:uncharacterized protein LOC127705183 isoform X4 [Mytilus californianus]